MDATIAILGAGVMGETLLSGLLRAGTVLDDVVITERRPERAAELADRYGVKVLENAEAVAVADTVVLVVKPQDIETLLSEIHDAVRPGALMVVIAAGISTAFVEHGCGGVAVSGRCRPPAWSTRDWAISPGGTATAAPARADAAGLHGKVVQLRSTTGRGDVDQGSGPAYISTSSRR